MKTKMKNNLIKFSARQSNSVGKIDLMGYSFLYPVRDDIYNKFKKEAEIDPEDTNSMKDSNEKEDTETWNENEVSEGHTMGDGLDVPGSELDDDEEDIGSEDEENNYYSIGGDNHNDLEENKGD